MTTKHHKVLISNSVRISLQKQVDYIAIEQQEPTKSLKWIDGIVKSILSLSKFPKDVQLLPKIIISKTLKH